MAMKMGEQSKRSHENMHTAIWIDIYFLVDTSCFILGLGLRPQPQICLCCSLLMSISRNNKSGTCYRQHNQSLYIVHYSNAMWEGYDLVCLNFAVLTIVYLELFLLLLH